MKLRKGLILLLAMIVAGSIFLIYLTSKPLQTSDFEKGSYKLTPQIKKELNYFAKTKISLIRNFIKLRISGYADSSGSKEVNKSLSKSRATEVAEYLQKKYSFSFANISGKGESKVGRIVIISPDVKIGFVIFIILVILMALSLINGLLLSKKEEKESERKEGKEVVVRFSGDTRYVVKCSSYKGVLNCPICEDFESDSFRMSKHLKQHYKYNEGLPYFKKA